MTALSALPDSFKSQYKDPIVAAYWHKHLQVLGMTGQMMGAQCNLIWKISASKKLWRSCKNIFREAVGTRRLGWLLQNCILYDKLVAIGLEVFCGNIAQIDCLRKGKASLWRTRLLFYSQDKINAAEHRYVSRCTVMILQDSLLANVNCETQSNL